MSANDTTQDKGTSIPTDDECADLAMKFLSQLGDNPQLGTLYWKIRSFAHKQGRLPEGKLVQTMCRRLQIDQHRSETGARGNRPGITKVPLDAFAGTGDDNVNLVPTPVEMMVLPTQRKIDFKTLVAQLPQIDQAALNYKAEGYTFAEIGQVLGGVSAQRIEQRISAAVAKLKELAKK